MLNLSKALLADSNVRPPKPVEKKALRPSSLDTNSEEGSFPVRNRRVSPSLPSLSYEKKSFLAPEEEDFSSLLSEASSFLKCPEVYLQITEESGCPQVFVTEGFFHSHVFKERAKKALEDGVLEKNDDQEVLLSTFQSRFMKRVKALNNSLRNRFSRPEAPQKKRTLWGNPSDPKETRLIGTGQLKDLLDESPEVGRPIWVTPEEDERMADGMVDYDMELVTEPGLNGELPGQVVTSLAANIKRRKGGKVNASPFKRKGTFEKKKSGEKERVERGFKYGQLLDKEYERVSKIADAVIRAFGGEKRPSPEKVEKVMRPFGVIYPGTEYRINQELRERDAYSVHYAISGWIEANFVVSGSGHRHAHKTRFLLMDPCTCAVEHLAEAIKHARRDVDPRIIELADNFKNNKNKTREKLSIGQVSSICREELVFRLHLRDQSEIPENVWGKIIFEFASKYRDKTSSEGQIMMEFGKIVKTAIELDKNLKASSELPKESE